MALPVPLTLSPSKVSAFKDCALAFRFSAVERIPTPETVPTAKGTLVHSTLQRLFGLEPAERSIEAALRALEVEAELARAEGGDLAALALDADAEAALLVDAERLVRNYFQLEDPRTVTPIGLELRLEVPVGDLNLVGIIDRLELDTDGGLVVTDYKTGRAPSDRYEQSKLGGVHFYSLLCEEAFGVRPAKVQLLHLHEPVVITSLPTDQSTRGLRTRVGAIWQAVTLACEREDFRPKPGPLCSWCSFQQWCPQFGGDPDRAAIDSGAAVGHPLTLVPDRDADAEAVAVAS